MAKRNYGLIPNPQEVYLLWLLPSVRGYPRSHCVLEVTMGEWDAPDVSVCPGHPGGLGWHLTFLAKQSLVLMSPS